jgi:hypothetical protein
MTKQVTKITDAVTRSTSRRGFLGRLAKLATGAAAGAAGLLAATPAHGWPGKGPNSGKPKKYCCLYRDWYGSGEVFTTCVNSKDDVEPCPQVVGDFWLQAVSRVDHCHDCDISLWY